MAFYEHTFIGKQDLSNKEVENLITKYSELINKTGKILKTEKWGLLNLASKINKNAPLAIRAAKKSIDIGYEKNIEESLKIEFNCYKDTLITNDRNEALKAFLEKRQPKWKGT